MITQFNDERVNVLAVGAGSLLLSLVTCLFDSGLSDVHVMLTDSEPTNRQSLFTLVDNAKKTDLNAVIRQVAMPFRSTHAWRDTVQPYDWILYASDQMSAEEIDPIQAACRAENKALLIATCIGQTGIAGPLVTPNSEVCWSSARRRIHQAVIRKGPLTPIIRLTAGPILTHIIVSEMFRSLTEITESELINPIYVMDLYTLEGSYHSILPHPLITQGISAEQVHSWDHLFAPAEEEDRNTDPNPNEFLSFINQITSPYSGILHQWSEGDLSQLPISQCLVQSVDPLSEGPAELLPIIICSGLTHVEARKEAGLAGIEAYVTRMSRSLGKKLYEEQQEQVEVGAGETVEEALYRGLQKCLTKKLIKRTANQKPRVREVKVTDVEDKHCRFYLQALATLYGVPTIGWGDDLFGFPVVWLKAGEHWYGCVSLNRTSTLRMTLQSALHKAQNPNEYGVAHAVEIPMIDLDETHVTDVEIKAIPYSAQAGSIQDAYDVLKSNSLRLLVYKLKVEPILNDNLGALLGVRLGEEDIFE
ncbi:bacteriocin maturation protein [Cohnella mopanensis]|uniref:bacteriocin maturation protein n=1 Tax=Cohnella mopanensis TaxID=2911966 RepID=UPI001EF780A2|nr:bacteriocin maturation protein [Cohnella mopanensis]